MEAGARDPGRPRTRLLAGATAACLMLAASAGGPAGAPGIDLPRNELTAAHAPLPAVGAGPALQHPRTLGTAPQPDSAAEGHPAFILDSDAVTTILLPAEPDTTQWITDRSDLGPTHPLPATNRSPSRSPTSPPPADHPAGGDDPPPSMDAAPPDAGGNTSTRADPVEAIGATEALAARPSPGHRRERLEAPTTPSPVTPTSSAAPAPDHRGGPAHDPPPAAAEDVPDALPPGDPAPVETWLSALSPTLQAVWEARPPTSAPASETGEQGQATEEPEDPTDPVGDQADDRPSVTDDAAVAWAVGMWWAVTAACIGEFPDLEADCARAGRALLLGLGLPAFDVSDWPGDEETRDAAAALTAHALDQPHLPGPSHLPEWVAFEGTARP